MGHTVLVVDGEAQHRYSTRRTLNRAGFVAVERESGAAALHEATLLQPDVVVVCADPQDAQGIAICNRFSLESDAPVVVHTSSADQTFTLRCFDAGATDVIDRTTPEPILIARVRAQARQHVARPLATEHVITSGSLVMNLNTRACTVADTPLSLTYAEFELLRELMHYPDHAISRAILLGALPHAGSNPRLLETHMSRIRRKIRDAGGANMIHSVRGIGYRFSSLYAR